MKHLVVFVILILATSCWLSATKDIPANPVVPSPQQVEYQKMEIIGFIHYTVNAFTDKEWGDGSERSDIFNPTELDVRQWVRAARLGGMQQLILTAKHHDGFCLWPSAFTEHSIKNSPYKDGRGDIVKELAEACTQAGLKFGVYLSPWDRNHPDYARSEYITYYRNQLRELLTNYGPISEMWFDGANGGDGWYGGANERRTIDRKTYYEWPITWNLVKELQPDILIFSDAGPDIRWIGNEKGIAGETCWSMFDRTKVAVGDADQNYLNTGDPDGPHWVVGECDVSIRPGWFYHKSEDDKVKTPQQLVDLYYKSVGRNGTLLLNIPPDQRGLIHENDVQSLKGFKTILDETFKENLARGAKVMANSQWSHDARFAADNIVDQDIDSYWAAKENDRAATLTLHLDAPATFDRIMLQEPVRLGQRIAQFTVEAQVDGDWQHIASATTIGYKRLLRLTPITVTQIRLKIIEANNTPALSNVGLFKASALE
ncbi:glycoside hydrolase family 29 [candidate division KSB1 bacterium]|nr:alpha-L-fucosidase [candidate division KSB1 bacterium]RQW06989.1 MAG: glycoside hydrolase family 29 [candidate division KSB1 bacterium]